jgi:hypothetical protein
MNDQRKLVRMIGAILVLFFMVGCGAHAISTPTPVSPTPTLVSPTPTIQPITPSQTPERSNLSLLTPVGRTAVVGGNTFQVMIDSELYDPQPTYDDYGGYWIEVPYNPKENSKVVLRFTINSNQKVLYREKSQKIEKWLRPSQLIDSDNPTLIEKAKQLTMNGGTSEEKARRIYEFVIGYLTFQPYGRHYLTSASNTYQLGYGTCVNFARLFVALSRAANVPARTVWGVTFNDGAYEHHHEWAEFLDDDGYWHPLDLSFTKSFNLSDINYLDLIYSSEENPLYEQSTSEEYSKDMKQFIVFDTTTQPYDGMLGFTMVENNSPMNYLVEHVFILADIPNLIPQLVP